MEKYAVEYNIQLNILNNKVIFKENVPIYGGEFWATFIDLVQSLPLRDNLVCVGGIGWGGTLTSTDW